MMTLLNGQSLQAKDRFQPETMALNLEERNSTATVTIGPEAPEIKINDWLRDETEPGAGIIWRVKTVNEATETKTRTLTLEHVIQYLQDRIIFGEATPKTITGNSRATTCTAREAAAYALRQQNLWRLGDLEASASKPYSFNGDKIFAALETVTSSLPDMQWEYDLSALPFTLHIRKQPTGFQSEMRMRRNITTMKVQVDRTRMYTRFYPIGKNNLHVDGDYIGRNENLYGVICKVETDQSLDTKEKLRAWAEERLARHSEPLVTVTVTGLELSAATGEPLDHIVIGRQCRIPVPEAGTVMTERVTKISWADKIKEPEKITVTLANLMEDVASIINSQSASSGRSSRNGAKKGEEDHAWFVDTSTHVGMVAEAVAGEGAATDWSRVASVMVDGEGIHQRVTRTENDVVAMWSSIDVLEDRIVLEVANAKSDTFSKIEQTASSIRTEVSSSKSSLWSSITQTSTQISLKVGKGEVISCINQTPESITIQARRVNLQGYVTADDLTAQYLSGIFTSAVWLEVYNLKVKGSFQYTFATGPDSSETVGFSQLVKDLQIVRSGNTYTLQKKNAGSTQWTDVDSFSRAITSWDFGWSNGTLTVTAQPQNQSTPEADKRTLVAGTKTLSGTTYSVPILAEHGTGTTYTEDTGKVITVDASEVYTNGKKAAEVTLSRSAVTTDSAYQKYLTYKASNNSNTSHNQTEKIYLVKATGKAQLRSGSATGTVIMEINTT